jgi:hypothetical protein
MSQRLNFWLWVAFLLGTTIQGRLEGQATPPTPTLPVAQIFLIASNKDGMPASLSKTDLSVQIDKLPVQITALRSAQDDKMLFALLVDTSASEARDAASIRAAGKAIFERLSNGGNSGYVVKFDMEIYSTKNPQRNSDAQSALDHFSFGGSSSIIDAIETTCNKILSRSANPRFPRRIIVLLSDGDDDSSRLRAEKAEQTAEQEGVAIFTLKTPHGDRNGPKLLRQASEVTGGQMILAHGVVEGVEPLLKAIREQWSLELAPPQASEQKLHTLSISDSDQSVHLSVPAHIFQ